MTTGIYLLVFSSGKIYIGQSINIDQRWQQHFDKFRKGTAAKSMQAEFDQYGFPVTKVLLECHKDHLNMLESMYINSNMLEHKHLMLNTSIPSDYTDAQIAIVTSNAALLKLSIIEIFQKHIAAKNNVQRMQEEVDSTVDKLKTLEKKGIVLPVETKTILKENKTLKEDVKNLLHINQMLSLEASKSWWQKLFN